MYHTPAANTEYYRVTRRGAARSSILSGMGSYFTLGGRYNRPQQRTVYASDDPLVSITEMAFYQALDWQERIGGGRVTPAISTVPPARPTFPLVSSHILWCFSLIHQPPVIAVDDPVAYQTFHHDPSLILNPGQFYETTEALADRIRAYKHPSHPSPQGLKTPSARTPASAAHQPYQYAFFVFGRKLGRILWRADLTVEFLDPAGHQVTRSTPRIDWSHPRFLLGGLAHPIPAFRARPRAVTYRNGQWYPLEVLF